MAWAAFGGSESLKGKADKRHVSRRTQLKGMALLIGLAVLLLLAYRGGRWLENRNARPETRGDHTQRYAYTETIEVDGVTYRRKANLTAILLMGIDQASDAAVSNGRNGGQADFLRLVVIDSEADTVSQIQIDRDTMTPITILGVLGNRSGVRTTQICLAHSFGDGGAESCELTVEAVSNLLLGTQIDDYIAMNLDGVSVLNDWLGGITVTLEDDFSAIDPAMTAGSTLTLTGEQAEIYVRSRRNVGVGTNEARMERQENYISLLTEQLDSRLGEGKEAVGALYDALEPYLTTDMSRGRLVNALWEAHAYTRTAPLEPDGSYEIGSDGFMEFHADDAALKNMVLDLFYTEVQ